MEEHVSPELDTVAPGENVMQTPRRRRQQGLIREALYVFLAVAIVMAVLLDGFAIFTVQQNARDDATDAGRKAKAEYVETGNLQAAENAAEAHVRSQGGQLLEFTSKAGTTAEARSFTVTVRHKTDTYLFHYLGYVPGLGDWVDETQNPVITRTTT